MRLILALGLTVVVLVIVVGLLQMLDIALPLWLPFPFVVVFLASMAFIGAVYRYKRPKADQALVRTGGRRPKITIGGGMWVNTIFHEIKEISFNTMDLTVTREQQDALMTLDFNRADIECVFYVSVQAEE